MEGAGSSLIEKDSSVAMNAMEVASILLNKERASRLSYKELLSLYFVDYQMLPLLIQENYLGSMGKKASYGSDELL